MDSISTGDALAWLVRMATVDGPMSGNAMALLKEFADANGLDLSTCNVDAGMDEATLLPDAEEEQVPMVKRVVRPMSELKKAQEEASQPKMSIRMPEGSLICRKAMTDTFRDFVMGMGWEDVRDMNFDVYGKDLITQSHPNGWYKELVPGWYVNTGMKANTMRTTAYEIARALGKKIVVSWE